MNVFKKLTALLLSSAAVFGCLAGCGASNDPNTLYIDAFEGGYGVEWLYALGEEFEKKNEGITVKINETSDDSTFSTMLMSGRSTADIVFERYPFWDRIFRPTVVGSTTYDPILEDLTDIYNAKIPGEDVTIAEKLPEDVRAYYETDGKYYHFNWAAGMMGLLYNKNVWSSSWKLPRTTDELISLADTIKKAGKVPFVYSLKDSYWGIYVVWAAQYEGLETMAAYDEGYAPNGKRYVPELALYPGFEEALKVLEVLLKDENGYCHSRSKEVDFTMAQNMFLEGDAVMQANGDWIESEMRANFAAGETDIEFMKMPVISSIVDKCPSITGTEEEKEAKLCAVVDYVDGADGATLPEGVTQQDVEYIRSARSMMQTIGQDHSAYIPVYSTKKDIAKKFFQFMASDEGIEIYVKSSGGYRTMFEYDYSKSELQNGISSFMKSTNALFEQSSHYFMPMKNKLFSLTGMQFMENGLVDVEVYLSASNPKDYKSASEIFLANYKNLEKEWTNYLNTAQIGK